MNPRFFRPAVVALTLCGSAATLLTAPQTAEAHCQVPCGIYGDELKFQELAQHIETVRKAMVQIKKLAGSHDAQDQQQLARWVANKESHADTIQSETQSYFLAQRIKLPKDESEHAAYFAKLHSTHQMIVYAMKCKQTVDTAHADALQTALDTFKSQYFGKDHAGHTH